jgi:branched-chain amino acid transport system substrate-binding protein
MGISLAQYAMNNGFHKLAVCIKGPEYIEEFIRSFYRESQNSDLRIVDYYTKTNTGDEFEEVFERWDLLGVDCLVIIHDSMYDAFNLLRAIRSKAPSMRILGDTNFDFKEKLAEYGEFSDNIVITQLLSIEHGEKQKLFERRYVEKYAAQPDDYALHGYDSVKMIVDTALSIDTNDSVLIAQELHNSGYDGISGTIRFDEKGNLLSKLPKILISKDGLFREVSYE